MTAGGCDELQGQIGQHVEDSSGARIEGGRGNRSRDDSGIKRKQRTGGARVAELRTASSKGSVRLWQRMTEKHTQLV